MIRIVYFGTAEIASLALCALHEAPDMEVVLAVTQPDRPRGRKRELAACPVKERASLLGLSVFSPDRLGDEEAQKRVLGLGADLHVVFAYGQYIPMPVADGVRLRSINAHPSLLPRYRGASPIQAALANGDAVTGLSVMYVAKEMDAGDVLLQERVVLSGDEDAGQLHDDMAVLGARLLVDAARALAAGTLMGRVQDVAEVVECGKLCKEDGRIDWGVSAEVLRNRVRAYTPWPGAFFEVEKGVVLKVLVASVEAGQGAPGTVLDVAGGGPLVATGDGALRLLEVQPAGKSRMSGDAYLRGNALAVGSVFGFRAPDSGG